MDPVIEPERHSSHGRIASLLEHVRRDENIALPLQAEGWTETNQLQGAVAILLDATSGANPEGLSTRVERCEEYLSKFVKNSQEQRAGQAHGAF